MPKFVSCGLLLFDRTSELRVLLAHPGGPYFAKRDLGAWSIPKGLTLPGERLLDTAKREFHEETGYVLSALEYIPLGETKMKTGKLIHAWAFEGKWETGRVPASNLFAMEWPPRSGNKQSFPEIDQAVMFTIEEARQKINPAQSVLLDRLCAHLGGT